MSKNIFSKKFLFIFSFISIIFIFILGFFDLLIAQKSTYIYLNNIYIKDFADFMDNEGQYFAYGIVAIAIIIYILSFIPNFRVKLINARKYCIYIIIIFIIGSFLSIRIFKIIFARPRPNKVLSGEFYFNFPFTFGGLDLLKALSSGSFCSGHTGTAAIFFTLPFIFQYKKNKGITILLISISIIYSFLMAIGRILSVDHFASDTVCSIYLMVILSWLFYYKILKIPNQEINSYNPEKDMGNFYWLRFLIFTIIFLLFITIFILDLKIILLPNSLSTNYSLEWLLVHPEYIDKIIKIVIPNYISIPLLLIIFILIILNFDLLRSQLNKLDKTNFIILKIIRLKRF